LTTPLSIPLFSPIFCIDHPTDSHQRLPASRNVVLPIEPSRSQRALPSLASSDGPRVCCAHFGSWPPSTQKRIRPSSRGPSQLFSSWMPPSRLASALCHRRLCSGRHLSHIPCFAVVPFDYASGSPFCLGFRLCFHLPLANSSVARLLRHLVEANNVQRFELSPRLVLISGL